MNDAHGCDPVENAQRWSEWEAQQIIKLMAYEPKAWVPPACANPSEHSHRAILTCFGVKRWMGAYWSHERPSYVQGPDDTWTDECSLAEVKP